MPSCAQHNLSAKVYTLLVCALFAAVIFPSKNNGLLTSVSLGGSESEDSHSKAHDNFEKMTTVSYSFNHGTDTSCAKDWREHIRLLSAAMRSDPETVALRAWTVPGGQSRHWGGGAADANVTAVVPGMDTDLLSAVFRGRRTVLMGDSTTRRLSKWLHALLQFADRDLTDCGLTNGTLSEVNERAERLTEGMRYFRDGKHPPKTVEEPDGTYMRYVPLLGSCHSDEWEDVIQMEPEVIVANRGLHWLHLINSGRNVKGCYIRKWLKYEAWIDEVITMAEASNAKVLLFKTTNLVCEEKFRDVWERGARLYSSGNEQMLSACIQFAQQAAPGLNRSRAELYCRNGTFNEAGAQHLNDRLYRQVQRRKNEVNLTLEVFNDHDVESCLYTEDGRHYPELGLMRVRLLGNTISCALGEIS